MEYFRRLGQFLNPMVHLGDRKYTVVFPLLTTSAAALVSDIYVRVFLHDSPGALGGIAVFVFIAFIVYFAFREGIVGGLTAVTVTIGYYIYIIFSRDYQSSQLAGALETTAVLCFLYGAIALIIGGLKQQIDVLVHKEAEARYRLETIIEQMPVGVVVCDRFGNVTLANKRVGEIMGAVLPYGYNIFKGPIVEARHKGREMVANDSGMVQALQTGKPVIGKEYELVRPDGKTVMVRVSSTPIRNQKGEIIAATSITQDVTTQKELERRKDDFVNMASHELKTPITSLKLYLAPLTQFVQKSTDRKGGELVKKIQQQAERIQVLVNGLLDVSRLQTGKLVFFREKFRLDELLGQLVDDLQISAGDITLQLAQLPTITVFADRTRIYQVGSNLITNAIKFSGESKEIHIKLTKNKNSAIVSVQDFGVGIAKDQQRKIFRRLYQVDDSYTKTFPGFGMGLYIAHNILVRHGGKIWVESDKGKGATFYFSLPVASAVR